MKLTPKVLYEFHVNLGSCEPQVKFLLEFHVNCTQKRVFFMIMLFVYFKDSREFRGENKSCDLNVGHEIHVSFMYKLVLDKIN